MKVKEYSLVEMCVENGVEYGYSRAFKHSDEPTERSIKDEIIRAVMNEMSEWFEFDNGFTIE